VQVLADAGAEPFRWPRLRSRPCGRYFFGRKSEPSPAWKNCKRTVELPGRRGKRRKSYEALGKLQDEMRTLHGSVLHASGVDWSRRAAAGFIWLTGVVLAFLAAPIRGALPWGAWLREHLAMFSGALGGNPRRRRIESSARSTWLAAQVQEAARARWWSAVRGLAEKSRGRRARPWRATRQ